MKLFLMTSWRGYIETMCTHEIVIAFEPAGRYVGTLLYLDDEVTAMRPSLYENEIVRSVAE